MHKFNQLPVEVRERIFVLAQNPDFRLACQSVYTFSKSDVIRARYLVQRSKSSQGNLSLSENALRLNIENRLFTASVLKSLVHMGANPKADNHFVFRWSAANGRLDFLKTLADLQQDQSLASLCSIDNGYCLRASAQNGHLPVVRYLVENGESDIHVNNDFPARAAAQFQQLDVVKYLLECGSDIHADDDFILRTSVTHGNTNFIQELLHLGANARAQDDEALILACVHGYDSIVQLLLSAQCDHRARNNMPLRASFQGKHWSLVKMLVLLGAPLEEDMVKELLLNEKWSILLPLYYGKQIAVTLFDNLALKMAVYQARYPIVVQLLNLGADSSSCMNLASPIGSSSDLSTRPERLAIQRLLQGSPKKVAKQTSPAVPKQSRPHRLSLSADSITIVKGSKMSMTSRVSSSRR